MKIGIPHEIKDNEGRVALIPYAVARLSSAGHDVYLATNAGEASGYSDDSYRSIGATILPDSQSVYAKADLIVKVKEPVNEELNWLQSHHILFSYLHLAANPELTQRLRDIGLTAIAFETVSEAGRLPLLAPMSEIAGRIAAQYGATLLYSAHQGRGVLLGGIAATERSQVVVIGAGMAGTQAALTCAALGANADIFDINTDKLAQLHAISPNISTHYAYPEQIHDAVIKADLVIGAVLLPGARAPHIITERTVTNMHKGSVLIDIAIDQGGCIEAIRPTSYASPYYLSHGVVHCAITNLPGAVPRTASQALSQAILPYVLMLTETDWRNNKQLESGVNVAGGNILLEALKNT